MHKNSTLVKYKNREANSKNQAQNEQIFTKTRLNYVLQQIEWAKWPWKLIKKQSPIQKSAKNKPKKQVNFNQNKQPRKS